MDNSLKIGAISGLVAGFISSIFLIIVYVLQFRGFNLGLGGFQVMPIVPLPIVAIDEIVHGLIFGIILGIIYSRIHCVIRRRYLSKALLFSFFLYAMFNLRFATIDAAYGRYLETISFIFWGIYMWIPFGIVLGILYGFLIRKYYVSKEELKITTYSMMSALLPSAIAALLGGMSTFVTILIAVSIGFWEWVPGQLSDIEFLISQFGSQTFFHFVWCTFFGLFFAKVYNLIPGKGVIKGLVYGLIGLLITEGRVIGYLIVNAPYFEAYGLEEIAHIMRFDIKQLALLGSTVWIVFGLVLGLLYRKPTETPAVKETIVPAVQVERCQHCGASIPKGSVFCNICGRKQ